MNTKKLSVFGLMMINIIAIDSIRNLPSNAAMGYDIVFYCILGALLFFLPCILITAELSTTHPKTGGSYVWAREAFGPRGGFVTIWLLWIYNVVWFPTILSFIAATVAYLFTQHPDPALTTQAAEPSKAFIIPVVIGTFMLASWINARGVRIAAWVSTVGAIIGTILPMILIITLGIKWLMSGKTLAIDPTVQQFFPNGKNVNNLSFLVVVLFSFMGIEMSAVHAGEVNNPQRNFPRALIYSGILIFITMTLASFAIAMIIKPDQLNIMSGIAQVFQAILPSWLFPLSIIIIVIGSFAGLSAWVLGPAKAFMVAAQDSELPKWLSKQNSQGAPVGALLAQAIVVTIISLLFLCFDSVSTAYWILSALTAQLALLYYIILFASAIRLRYVGPKTEGAYRIPGGNVGMWITGLVGIVTCTTTIGVGFLPPTSPEIHNLWGYEAILALGIALFAGLPFVLYKKKPQVL